MTTTAHPIEQLEQITIEFHHLSEEFKREGDQGSTRRSIGKRLDDLDERFNHLLMHWVTNEPKQKAWYEHLHHDGPRPEDDLALYPPFFVGQSTSGSELQVRPNSEGTYDVLIDGGRVDRVKKEMTFPENTPANILDQQWTEMTNINEAALEALRQYCAGGEGKLTPPWQWARVLYGDGLIDVNFSLTARGRRILNR